MLIEDLQEHIKESIKRKNGFISEYKDKLKELKNEENKIEKKQKEHLCRDLIEIYKSQIEIYYEVLKFIDQN